ncbi:DUF1778 domain-containing protein [Xylanimonas ulmi]|nr:DUF1778 domain-containing protein [Xylanibacterium ulmi]
MSTTAEAPREARFDLRMSREARALLDEAAAINGVSLTDYVLSKVVPAARHDLLEARTIRLGRQAWDEFVAILDKPDDERLAALRTHAAAWGQRRA